MRTGGRLYARLRGLETIEEVAAVDGKYWVHQYHGWMNGMVARYGDEYPWAVSEMGVLDMAHFDGWLGRLEREFNL